MEDSLFETWVIGGGWAMFLLVPAAVVALATFLRGLLTLRGYEVDRSDTAAPEVAAIRPLLLVYALAPLLGAAATLSRLVSSANPPEGGVLYVPMIWGVAVALFAGAAYYGLLLGTRRSRPNGETGSGLLILPGLVALVAAVVICGYGHTVVRSGAQGPASSAEPTLHVKGAPGSSDSPGEVPVVEVTAAGFIIDDQAVAAEDILFRLTALATRQDAVIVRTAPDVTAQRLAEALALVNQAGFVHVGVDAQ